MTLIMDQQQTQHKHYCRICRKGFGCGRALGGHMRAHGISDDSAHMDDEEDDHTSDWEAGNVSPTTNKHMYALRTNPNRLKSCRTCENCGKEFSSWKSFLEHGKCTSDDAESLVSSPRSDAEDGVFRNGYAKNYSKRKRSFRTKVGGIYNPNFPSSEEEDLAHCLMMLSKATVDPLVIVEPEESCASASKEEERRHPLNFVSNPYGRSYKNQALGKAKESTPKGLFECKACKKVFSSHQALGGHRASHKKVKGCFAAKLDHTEDNLVDEDHDVITHEEFLPTKSSTTLQFNHGRSSSKKKAKVHECSICHRVFSSGQALGGHKRCHWITSNNSLGHASYSIAKFNNNQFHDQRSSITNNLIKNSETLDLTLDLNFPAMVDTKPGDNQVSKEIFLLPWVGVDENDKNKDDGSNYHNKIMNVEDTTKSKATDETNQKAEFAKLSELKEMNATGSSSHWLQVGIGSTSGQVEG